MRSARQVLCAGRMTTLLTEGPSVLALTAQRSWRALRYFNLYRLLIAGTFAGLAWAERLTPPTTYPDAALIRWTATLYFSAALAFGFVYWRRPGGLTLLRNLQLPLDVLCITLLVQGSGGVSGGFGILLVVATAGSCLLAGRRTAVAYASLATLALLAQTLYGIARLDYAPTSYAQAALLGLTCFAAGLLSAWLAEQARTSEELAAARAVELRNLAQLNEYIVQRMQSGILVLDEGINVVLANEAALRMAGQAAATPGRSLVEFSEPLSKAWLSWVQRGENPRLPLALGAVGAEAIVSFARLDRVDGVSTLVFMQEAAETHQRVQQLKLASLGRLTASIAHEIRNPLGAISHAGQLLEESLALSVGDRRLVQIIAQHSARMNDIVSNVLIIGRRMSASAERFALVPWLNEFLAEITEQHALAPGALVCASRETAIIVHMDKSQLHQVLSNLAQNALRYSRDLPLVKFLVARQPGTGRPVLDVCDTGPGMPATDAQQIFEPFFTGVGGGTGLGLYIARELCEANQATLVLLSAGSEGCVFRLCFAHPDALALVN